MICRRLDNVFRYEIIFYKVGFRVFYDFLLCEDMVESIIQELQGIIYEVWGGGFYEILNILVFCFRFFSRRNY